MICVLHKRRYINLHRYLTVALFVILSIASLTFGLYLIYIANTIYMLIIAILFNILSILTAIFNIFSAYAYNKSYYYSDYIDKLLKKAKIYKIKRYPTVGIAVPVFNEDPYIVEKNLLRLKQINYPKDKFRVYLLDDSDNLSIKTELERFCKENDIEYIRRESRKGLKAGALNNFLRISKEDYVAFFDYDEYLKDINFLKDLIPIFLMDKKVAFVQTRKDTYGKGLFQNTIRLFDGFFFNFIEPARAFNNTAIFAGSCGIINRSIILKLGGFPEYVIEDTFFSLEANIHNYKGIYVPKVYAYGRALDTFTSLAKQQWRYNYGDTQFLVYYIKRALNRPKSILTNIEYIIHGLGLNYISSFILFFTILSIFIVFSSLPFVHITLPQLLNIHFLVFDLELFGLFSFLLSLAVPILITKFYFNSFRKGLFLILINFALIIVRTKAMIAALFKLDPSSSWVKVKNSRSKGSILRSISAAKFEILTTAVFLILAYIAVYQHIFIGSIWLLWYSTIYATAVFFFYRYG
ncbi:MAG: glycosyltransferase AglI [Candidatus Micrarchaeota archaeon]|nr:MAG: glycosyltransferase AglI [Candidatus Micrarchaeota archaeon]